MRAPGDRGKRQTAVLERAARFVADLREADLPERVRERARWQAMSVLAAALSGARTRHGGAPGRAALAWGTRGHAAVIGAGARAHPLAAVVANAAASMALDYDDYGLAGHTGHSAVLAALAAAEQADADVGTMTVAQVAANEVAGRLGLSVLAGPHNGQMWAPAHLLGAAAAAAKVTGLGADAIADAMGIALSQPPFPLRPGFFSEAKVLTAATPAAVGLIAADLAAGGMRGPRDAIEAPGGFWRHFAYRPLAAAFGGFGRRWVTDTLAFKLHPGCAYLLCPVEALLELCGGRPAPAADIEVRVTLLTWGMERMGAAAAARDPISPVAVNFSTRLSLAAASLAGRLTPAELSHEFLAAHAADLRARAARVRLVHDPSLTAALARAVLPPLARGRWDRIEWRFAAEVRMAGRRARRDLPAASPGRPQKETARLVLDKLARETPAAGRVAALLADPRARAREVTEALAG